LAYATSEPRGTRDIDVNVFVRATQATRVFAALPSGVGFSDADAAEAVLRDQAAARHVDGHATLGHGLDM